MIKINHIGSILCRESRVASELLKSDIPISLVEIKENFTILDKQLFDFRNVGINKIILFGSHLIEQIKNRYGKRWKGVKLEYVKGKNKKIGYLIKGILEKTENDVVAVNDNVVTDINLKIFIKYSKTSKFPATLSVIRNFTKYKEKIKIDQYIDTGAYFFKKGFKKSDLYKGIEDTSLLELAKQNKIDHYQEDVFWRSIENSKDLDEVRIEYENRVDKPWGYEKILSENYKYTTKELYIKKGYRTSFHKHSKKDEIMYVLKGEGYIKFEDRKKDFSVNDILRIKPNMSHSIVALENTKIKEVSTKYPGDVIRIEDYYSRNKI